MKKIIEQNLNGDFESASKRAEYTWNKDEEAYIFNNSFNCISKVRFTGETHLAGNKWGYHKMYGYKELENSHNPIKLHNTMYDSEDKFYTTKEEISDMAIKNIQQYITRVVESCSKDIEKIKSYAGNL